MPIRLTPNQEIARLNGGAWFPWNGSKRWLLPELRGSGGWHFADLLDVVGWCSEATQHSVKVVVSNIADPQRLFDRIGFRTKLVNVPTSSRTRRARIEMIATNIPASDWCWESTG